MSRRSARTLAWSLFGVYVLSVAATLWLVATGSGAEDDAYVVMATGYAIVGVLVAIREPANAVGWMLLVAGAWFGLGNLAYAYSRVSDRPGELAVAWFAEVGVVPPIYIATMLLPMLFPTGRPLTPRWRLAVVVVLIAAVLSILGLGLDERTLDVESPTPIANPLGVSGPLTSVVTAVGVLGVVLAVAGIVLGAVSLVLRLRRSRGRERQQVKVMAYVAVAVLLDVVVVLVGWGLDGPDAPSWVEEVQNTGWLVGILLISIGLPVAIGIAILRYRLYAIDVVINRTLVYGALTLSLAASYLGLVVVLQLVLSPVTGESDLAVATSTLAVAALFRPLRSRIQHLVDRRFYRERYDATLTLEGFAGRLRDQLDLETLGTDLRAVVHDTMQPAHVSLWLRGGRR